MRTTNHAESGSKTVLVLTLLAGSLMAASPSESQTGGSIRIYSTAELASRDSLYRNWINDVFRYDLIGQLPINERSLSYDVTLSVLGGVQALSPIAVASSVPERRIYFPIQTLAFLDDISTLAAWLSRHDCSFEPGSLYAGMVAVKSPPIGGARYPNPRAAFGLGDDVWDDPFVKRSSNQIFKTAVYFTLAHELGHIRFGHAPYDSVTKEQAQAQELQADRYAIDVMRYIGVPPLGMFSFFTILARMEGLVATTHPLSGSRLLQIATAMEQFPGDFVPPNESKSAWAPVIMGYGQKFRSLIPVVDNPALRQQLILNARNAHWSELMQLCG